MIFRIKSLIVELDCKPNCNKNLLKTKIRSYGDEATDFHSGKIPEAGYIYWSVILIDCVLKEMYNTMNSYYKYTSIPKSYFYKINILILPINTGEKSLKYSIHFASTCNYQPL